jgi:reactive chlorine resistance protein C
VVGSRVLRYGLVLIIGWIGLMKFTGYEAKGIQPLLAHGPLTTDWELLRLPFSS